LFEIFSRFRPVFVGINKMSKFLEELPVAPRLSGIISNAQLLEPRTSDEQMGNLAEDYDEWLERLKGNGLNIRYISHPSEELCLAAVQQTGLALEFISSPSYAVCYAAIEQKPYAIRFLRNPHATLVALAVQKEPSVVRYFHPPV
jgi:hypothetical protein